MTGRRLVHGAWTDDPTDAARTAGPVDHDAGMRQARTAMTGWRTGWSWQRPDGYAGRDDDATVELARMTRLDRDRIEAIAWATCRTYAEVTARWEHLHPATEKEGP